MNPQVHVRLPDDLLDWLREDAKRNDRTVAWLVRKACEEYRVSKTVRFTTLTDNHGGTEPIQAP